MTYVRIAEEKDVVRSKTLASEKPLKRLGTDAARALTHLKVGVNERGLNTCPRLGGEELFAVRLRISSNVCKAFSPRPASGFLVVGPVALD
jgi:hypothetical protein